MRPFLSILLLALAVTGVSAQQPIRVVVAGLNHDHAHGILHRYKDGKVDIVGIAEPNKELWVIRQALPYPRFAFLYRSEATAFKNKAGRCFSI